MTNHSVFQSTRNAIYVAGCLLPFTLLGAIAGVTFVWASGINFFSVLFTSLGTIGSWALLNSAWTKIELTESGISKKTLLRTRSEVKWNEVTSWTLFEPTDESSHVVLKTENRKRMVVNESDVESLGLPRFLAELRNFVGQLESKR